MSEIINLRERAKETELCIWKCNCGNCSFMLYENGHVQCATCDAFQNDGPHLVAVKRWTRKSDTLDGEE